MRRTALRSLPRHLRPHAVHLLDRPPPKDDREDPPCADKRPEDVDPLQHVQHVREVPVRAWG